MIVIIMSVGRVKWSILRFLVACKKINSPNDFSSFHFHFMLGVFSKFYFKTLWPFLWMGFKTASRLEPLRGGSLLFTNKFPESPGTHFIDL